MIGARVSHKNQQPKAEAWSHSFLKSWIHLFKQNTPKREGHTYTFHTSSFLSTISKESRTALF